MVAEPTMGDGSVAPVPVPLISNVLNSWKLPASPPASTPKLQGTVANTTDREQLAAPAVLYVGESTFDGQPALIIDYYGMDVFTSFRDEMRHVGCGVWLGKTYLTGPPSSLAESLRQVRLQRSIPS